MGKILLAHMFDHRHTHYATYTHGELDVLMTVARQIFEYKTAESAGSTPAHTIMEIHPSRWGRWDPQESLATLSAQDTSQVNRALDKARSRGDIVSTKLVEAEHRSPVVNRLIDGPAAAAALTAMQVDLERWLTGRRLRDVIVGGKSVTPTDATHVVAMLTARVSTEYDPTYRGRRRPTWTPNGFVAAGLLLDAVSEYAGEAAPFVRPGSKTHPCLGASLTRKPRSAGRKSRAEAEVEVEVEVETTVDVAAVETTPLLRLAPVTTMTLDEKRAAAKIKRREIAERGAA